MIATAPTRPATGYGVVARTLHWLMAALLILQWFTGEYDDAFGGKALHFGLGLTLFALVLLRLGWRITHPAPPLPSPRRWERALARAMHYAWYALMLALPASGILARQLEGRATGWFGVFEVPPMMAVDKGLAHTMEEAHEVMATIFLVLLALHVLAALKHHFVDRDDVLRGMIGGPR